MSWILNRFFLRESRSLRNWNSALIPILFKGSCAVGLIPMNKLHLTFSFPCISWNLHPIALEHSCSFLSCIDENFYIKKKIYFYFSLKKNKRCRVLIHLQQDSDFFKQYVNTGALILQKMLIVTKWLLLGCFVINPEKVTVSKISRYISVPGNAL